MIIKCSDCSKQEKIRDVWQAYTLELLGEWTIDPETREVRCGDCRSPEKVNAFVGEMENNC